MLKRDVPKRVGKAVGMRLGALCFMCFIWPANAFGEIAGQEDPGFAQEFARVSAMTRLQSGLILLAGTDISIPAEATSRELIRISDDGVIDLSFAAGKAEQAGQAGGVNKVFELSDRRLFVYGVFSIFDGHVTSGIARLQEDGPVDTTFQMPPLEALQVMGGSQDFGLAIRYRTESGETVAGLLSANARSLSDLRVVDELTAVDYVQFQSDGAIVGLANSILRLRPDGTIDPTFTSPVSSTEISGFEVLEDDTILVWTNGASSIEGTNTTGLLKLLPNGGVDPTFNATTATGLISVLEDGRILASTADGGPIRLAFDGALDPGFVSRPNLNIKEATLDRSGNILALQPESPDQGKLIRLFGSSSPLAQPELSGRPVGTGLMHLSWTPVDGALSYTVEQRPEAGLPWERIADIPAGTHHLLVPTSAISSVGFRVIAMEAPDNTATSPEINVRPLANGWSFAGALDSSFRASVMPERSVPSGAMAVMADGGLLIGGTFSEVNGFPWAKSLARLSSTGELISSFEVPEIGDKAVLAISIDAGGKYLIAWQDGARQRVDRFLEDGSGDATFSQISLQGTVNSIDSLADGNTLVRGVFTLWNNASYREEVALVDNSGELISLTSSELENFSTYGPSFELVDDVISGGTFLNRIFPGDIVDQSFRLLIDGAFRSNRDSRFIDETSRSLFLHGRLTGINGQSTSNFVRIHLDRPPPRIADAKAQRSNLVNTLTWAAVADATTYHVHSVDSRGRLSLIGKIQAPLVSYTHATNQEGQRYAITAITDIGETRPSQPFDDSGWVPVAPDGLTWFSESAGSIRLTWSDIEGDKGYTVKLLDRREVIVGSTAINETSFNVAGLAAGKEFNFEVGTHSVDISIFDDDLLIAARTLDGSPPSWDADLKIVRLDESHFFVGFNPHPDAAYYRISSDQLALTFEIPSSETGAIIALQTPGAIGPITANAHIGFAAISSEDVSGSLLPLSGNQPGAVDRSYSADQSSLSLERLAVDSADRLILAGSFTSIDLTYRRGIARLLTNGALDRDFVQRGAPTADWQIPGDYDLAVLPDDVIRIKDRIINSEGELLSRFPVVPLDAAPFTPGSAVGQLHKMARFGDGASFALGDFYSAEPELDERRGAIFDKDSAFERYVDFDAGDIAPSSGSALVSMPDGRVLIGGKYLVSRDGSIDSSAFSGHPFSAAYEPWDAKLQGDDHVLLVGNFSDGTNPVRYLIRFKTDGQFDSQFAAEAQPNTFVSSMAIGDNGGIHLAGAFESCGMHQTQFVARLNPDGSVDDSFAVGPEAFSSFGRDVEVPRLIAVQSDGDIVVGERLTRLLGASRPNRTFSNAVVGRSEGSNLRVLWSPVDGALGYAVEEEKTDGEWQWIAATGSSSTELVLADYSAGSELRITPLFGNLEGASKPVLVDPSGFQAWLVSFGLDSSLAADFDADGDGLPLVIEYGLSLSPVDHDVTSGSPPLVRTNDGGLAFQINDPKPDVAYEIELSDDLQNWEAAPSVELEDVSFRIPTTESNSSRYARIRLSYR